MLALGVNRLELLTVLLLYMSTSLFQYALAETCQTTKGKNWKSLVKIVESGDDLVIKAEKMKFTYNLQTGENIELELDLPIDGYLNIVSVGPDDSKTVLFPNQYHHDNSVTKGRMLFPNADSFKWEAWPPCGKSLVVAFLFKKELNLYEQSLKDKGLNISSTVLAPLSDKATRSLTDKANRDTDFVAGQIFFDIVPE
jgi:hypothetical protein